MLLKANGSGINLDQSGSQYQWSNYHNQCFFVHHCIDKYVLAGWIKWVEISYDIKAQFICLNTHLEPRREWNAERFFFLSIDHSLSYFSLMYICILPRREKEKKIVYKSRYRRDAYLHHCLSMHIHHLFSLSFSMQLWIKNGLWYKGIHLFFLVRQ